VTEPLFCTSDPLPLIETPVTACVPPLSRTKVPEAIVITVDDVYVVVRANCKPPCCTSTVPSSAVSTWISVSEAPFLTSVPSTVNCTPVALVPPSCIRYPGAVIVSTADAGTTTDEPDRAIRSPTVHVPPPANVQIRPSSVTDENVTACSVVNNPVPPITPPVQLMAPVTVKSPAPVRVPPDCV
jgi:hypothetical protein